MAELREAIQQLKSRRATGMSGVPIEPIKFGFDEGSLEELLKLFNKILSSGKFHRSFDTVLSRFYLNQVMSNNAKIIEG